jgi:hypothetical protein
MQSLEGAASLPLARPAAAVRARVESRRFFVRMGYACAFVAIAGFTPSYQPRRGVAGVHAVASGLRLES